MAIFNSYVKLPEGISGVAPFNNSLGTPARILTWQISQNAGSARPSPSARGRLGMDGSSRRCPDLSGIMWNPMEIWKKIWGEILTRLGQAPKPGIFSITWWFFSPRCRLWAEEPLHDQGVLEEGRTIPRVGSFGPYRPRWSLHPGLGE